MIISNKKHALDYLGINENLDKALKFIAETDFSKLDDGLHLIDGMDCRVKVQHMMTKKENEAKLEAHDLFADIQMVFEGQECYGLAFRNSFFGPTMTDPEKDISFYSGTYAKCVLNPDEFLIVFPDDVHAPGICCDEPAEIRKGVFKVKL